MCLKQLPNKHHCNNCHINHYLYCLNITNSDYLHHQIHPVRKLWELICSINWGDSFNEFKQILIFSYKSKIWMVVYKITLKSLHWKNKDWLFVYKINSKFYLCIISMFLDDWKLLVVTLIATLQSRNLYNKQDPHLMVHSPAYLLHLQNVALCFIWFNAGDIDK